MTDPTSSPFGGGCPFSRHDYSIERPALGTYELLNAEREASRFHYGRTDHHEYLMLTRYDDVWAGLQDHNRFSNSQESALAEDLSGVFVPQSTDPPRHGDIRRLLNPYFSPKAVARLEDLARGRVAEMIAEVAPEGSTNMAVGFAIRYPTEIFLKVFGAPLADGDKLLPWIEAIFGGLLKAGAASAQDAETASQALRDYLSEAVDERRTEPRDPDTDLITRLVQGRVEGQPLEQDEMVTICMSVLAAGLDTTRSALGYSFYHLATHLDLRREVVADPSLWPKFVEEIIRLYPLVFQLGREVVADTDFDGVPMSAGDRLWLGIASANRDPRTFDNPDTFDLHRDNMNHHIAFGIGQHRCLGMHLARRELVGSSSSRSRNGTNRFRITGSPRVPNSVSAAVSFVSRGCRWSGTWLASQHVNNRDGRVPDVGHLCCPGGWVHSGGRRGVHALDGHHLRRVRPADLPASRSARSIFYHPAP